MMKALRTSMAAAVFVLATVIMSEAKHIKPAIQPVEIDGIRYEAPNDEGFRGYVRAYDAKTGTNLWEKTIYRVIWRTPFPELDMYYCVITDMKARDGSLLIQNDRKKWYALDPKTRKVRRITPEGSDEGQKNSDGQPGGGAYPAPAARLLHGKSRATGSGSAHP